MKKIDLFVYGTLVNDAYVKIIAGKAFTKEKAVLPSFRKVTPAGGFPYIKPLPGVFVNGFVLRGVDEEALKKFDAYEDEGSLYHRVAVQFWVGDKNINGQTYVGNIENLRKFYHSKINAETRVEKHLESQADQVIKEEITDRGLLDLIGLNARMLKELRGQMVEGVVQSAFEVNRPPDTVALNSLRNAKIPSLTRVKKRFGSAEIRRCVHFLCGEAYDLQPD